MDNLRGDISQTFIKTNTKGNFCTIFCPKKVADLGGTGRICQTVFEGILKIFRDLKFFSEQNLPRPLEEEWLSARISARKKEAGAGKRPIYNDNNDNYKVNRCLARYSPRATTTNRPTNRAPKKPAWPGRN